MITAEQYLVKIDPKEYQSLLEFDDFKQRAMNALNAIGESIEFNTSEAKRDFLQEFHVSLEAWQNDESHGLRHSHNVFLRALEIRDAEKVSNTEVSDDELFIRAVLHDLGEFVPLLNAEGNIHRLSKDKNFRSKKHPEIIAKIVLALGDKLEINDASQLALDLRYHDFYWTKPTKNQIDILTQRMSKAGKFLADADRLVDKTADSIGRNRIGSLGKWYLIRTNMNASDRLEWQMRTKGLFDGLSALLTEYINKDYWFYTETGREMNKERRAEFEEQLIMFYADEYEKGWQLLNESGQNVEVGIKLSGQNGKPETVHKDDEVKIQKIVSMTDRRQMIQELVKTPVAGKGSNGREYYGYSIYLPDPNSDKGIWLDPSVLQFESADALKSALENAIREFPQLLEEYMFDKEKKEKGVT